MKLKGLALNDIVTVALAFLLIGVTGAIGLYINSQVATTASFGQAGYPCGQGYLATNNTQAACAISNASSGVSTLLSWLPLIAVIVAAGIVISVLVSAFVMRKEGV